MAARGPGYFEEMKTFVAASCERWNRRELKGSRLKPKQVMEVADFLATQPIAAVAFVTDNQVMTEEVVTHHRSWQASLVAQARDAYGRRTDASDERLAAATATIELVGVGMSDVEFAQQQQVPELLFTMVQRALDRYRDVEWDPEFETFSWVIDAKAATGLSPGEKYAFDNAMRAIGSTERFRLVLPFEWQKRPNHPFLTRHAADAEHTSLNSLWQDTREHAASHDHAGLQLADIVANVVRRAIEDGSSSSTIEAYDRLRLVLTDLEGNCLNVYRFRHAPTPDVARYTPLMRAWP